MKKLVLGILTLFYFSCYAQDPKNDFKLELIGLTNLSIPVLDLDKSEKFYLEILGLERMPIPERFLPLRRWLQVSKGFELQLEYGRTKILEMDFKKEVHFRWMFPKGNFEKNIAYFKELKIPFEIIRGDEKEANRIYINDLDGYVIELVESREEIKEEPKNN